jgi:hypothetical protein
VEAKGIHSACECAECDYLLLVVLLLGEVAKRPATGSLHAAEKTGGDI